jgi:hypothetical protein
MGRMGNKRCVVSPINMEKLESQPRTTSQDTQTQRLWTNTCIPTKTLIHMQPHIVGKWLNSGPHDRTRGDKAKLQTLTLFSEGKSTQERPWPSAHTASIHYPSKFTLPLYVKVTSCPGCSTLPAWRLQTSRTRGRCRSPRTQSRLPRGRTWSALISALVG